MASYPSSIVNLSDPLGTSPVTSPDHAALHGSVNAEIEAIETTLGATSGTNVLKDFSAGQFPARVNAGGTIVQTLTGGTINTTILGNPTISLTSSTEGDIYYRNSGGSVSRLGIGTNGQVLTTNGTTPSWGDSNTTQPSCSVYLSTIQSIPNNTVTALSWDAEQFDTSSMHGTANPTRITVPSAGKYLVTSNVWFAANGTARRVGYLQRNGTAIIASGAESPPPGASNALSIVFSKTVNLAANDYIEVFVYQNSGGTLGALGGSNQEICGCDVIKLSS